MDNMIKKKLSNVIRAEADYVIKHETNTQTKLSKVDTLFNLEKILNNYDELEPILKDYFNKKAEKEKWSRGER